MRELSQDDIFGAASNLAFNWLLALIPMLIFVFALFGIFASQYRQLEDSLFSFTAALFVAISFSLIDYFGPNVKERRWHWLTPGSVFGVLLWLAASLCFRVYIQFFNTYSATYGSLGAVILLLLWLYVTGFAFLLGGVINAETERASTGTKGSE